MTIINKKEPILLGLGDVVVLALSLYVTLLVRSWTIPSASLIGVLAFPFSIIFLYSILVFYISGLYGRMISIARSSIPGNVIVAQIFNGIVAVVLFYFVAGFSVAPKTILFIYLIISTILLVVWRVWTYSILSLQKKYPALVIGSGPEMREIIQEMQVNSRIGLYCEREIDPANVKDLILPPVQSEGEFRYIVADMNDPHLEALLPELYRHFFPKVQIIDLHILYEEIFNRIPLSCMNYAWIMSNINSASSKTYDILKRLMDIFFGIVVGIAACIAYPFVALAIKMEGGGPVFILQERIGRNNVPIHIYKFRSMTRSDRGKWLPESDNKVTRVGRIIRKTSIDELPQALAFLKGDMSLIGPRADIVDLGKRLEREIPYHPIRTVITPGLTGWAQINQEKPPQSVEENKIRLSYDLYYIKHRSFGLDVRIVLRTAKTLLSRIGM
jgi:lipopolysaccharide/colanic/teichoic acid biosynthesis glycosyltransferase